MSLPSWERGLKYKLYQLIVLHHVSLPSWERGLKFTMIIFLCGSYCVAPLVGAWIEIDVTAGMKITKESLPSWERGLKCFLRLCV